MTILNNTNPVWHYEIECFKTTNSDALINSHFEVDIPAETELIALSKLRIILDKLKLSSIFIRYYIHSKLADAFIEKEKKKLPDFEQNYEYIDFDM